MPVHETLSSELPTVRFVQPFTIHKEEYPEGGVSILDIGLDNRNPDMAIRWLEGLGSQLVLYLDHHQTPTNFRKNNSRYRIYSRKSAPSCPRPLSKVLLADPAIVDSTRTLFAHGDFDGVMSAATFLLRGREPYLGAFFDADIFDAAMDIPPTRMGEVIQRAIKGNLQEDWVRYEILKCLTTGSDIARQLVIQASKKYDTVLRYTTRKAAQALITKGVAFVGRVDRSKIDQSRLGKLLLRRGAEHYVMEFYSTYDRSMRTSIVTQSSLDLLEIFGIPAGARFRVTFADEYSTEEILDRIGAAEDIEKNDILHTPAMREGVI